MIPHSDPKKLQFARGIKLANVPAGRADNVVIDGSRLFHVNCVMSPLSQPTDRANDSGVLRFRGHDFRRVRVPASISHYDIRSVDRFGNPVFVFTGRYADGAGLPVFGSSFWSIEPGQSTLYLHSLSGYAAGVWLSGSFRNNVIIAGGMNHDMDTAVGTIFGFSSLYSLSTDQWSALSFLPVSRYRAAGVIMGRTNGGFLVAGGVTATETFSSTGSAVFMTGTTSWVVPTGSLICGRAPSFEMVELLDGRIFVPGGAGVSASIAFTGSEMYHPNSFAWYSNSSTLPAVPLFPMNRAEYSLTLLDDGSVLMLGGRDSYTAGTVPAVGTHISGTAHALRFFPNNVLVPGSTGSWTIEPSMSFSRYRHRATKLHDGRVFVAGGGVTTGDQRAVQPISDAEIYDPSSRAWSSAGQMKDIRCDFGIETIKDGQERVIVVGGRGTNADLGFGTGLDMSPILSSSEIFDVETNSWSRLASLPRGVTEFKFLPLYEHTASSPILRFIIPDGVYRNEFRGDSEIELNRLQNLTWIKRVDTIYSASFLATGSASSVSFPLLRENPGRRRSTVFNGTDQNLYVKFGSRATAAVFTARVLSGFTYELPKPTYTDQIWGIFASTGSGVATVFDIP